jgi:hypothetical protein
MYSHKLLSNLEYFEHWPLDNKLCEQYIKKNIKISLIQGEDCNVLF